MLGQPLSRAARGALPATMMPRSENVGARNVLLIERRRLLGGLLGVPLALAWPSLGRAADEIDPLAEAAVGVELINAYRQAQGLAPLARSRRLDEAARAHAEDMARHDRFSHTSSDGTGAFDRIRSFYPYETWLGENIGAGFRTAGAIVGAWQGSPAHNDNLLLAEFQAIGLAVAVNKAATFCWYWACDFGGQRDLD
jgi:uncharacterized protein YkwD